MLFCAKKVSKKHPVFENDNISKMAKIGHHATAIAFARASHNQSRHYAKAIAKIVF